MIIISVFDYLQKNEKMNNRFEKNENLIEKHQSEIAENQLINWSKDPNH